MTGFGRILPGGTQDAPFAPERLIAAANARAPREVVLDATAQAGLAVLSDDLNAAPFSFTGRKLAQALMVETLVKRAWFAPREGTKAAKPKRPVFIIAPFRSGTTFLHRLMAQDPAFRAPRTWEVSLAPDPQARAHVTSYLTKTARLSPDLARLHPTGAELPEECFGLLEPSLMSPSFMFLAPVPRYLRWLSGCGPLAREAAYQLYANGLAALGGSGRWLLKSPVHMWGLGAILRVFPDAQIIQLHRCAGDVMRSYEALLAAHRRLYLRDGTGVAEAAFDTTQEGLSAAIAARKTADPARFIDLSYDALVADPVGEMGALYAQLDMALSAQARAAMQGWLRENTSTPRPARAAPPVPPAFAGYAKFAPANIRCGP